MLASLLVLVLARMLSESMRGVSIWTLLLCSVSITALFQFLDAFRSIPAEEPRQEK